MELSSEIIDGIMLSVTGMFIVFAALAGIAVILGVFPKFMSVLNSIIPENTVGHGSKKVVRTVNDDSAIAVAIATAFHKSKSE